jgi:hypothetical protein
MAASQAAALAARVDELNAALAVRPAAPRLEFARETEEFIKSEAKARNVKPDALIRLIVEAVVEDRLFAAVLDR